MYVQFVHKIGQAFHGFHLRGEHEVGEMQFKMHAHFGFADALERAHGLTDAAERHARARGIAGLVGAHEGKGHNVDAAPHDLPGKRFVHAQPAGGCGDPAARLARQRREIHEPRVQERFAPALQVHAPALLHERPQAGEGRGFHVPRAPISGLRGMRAIDAAPRANGGDFHLYAVKQAGFAEQAFPEQLPNRRFLKTGVAQRIGRAAVFCHGVLLHAEQFFQGPEQAGFLGPLHRP